MAVTAAELIEELHKLDPDTEVKIAIQPGWPFQCHIQNIVVEENGIWLAASEPQEYLPKEVAEECW